MINIYLSWAEKKIRALATWKCRGHGTILRVWWRTKSKILSKNSTHKHAPSFILYSSRSAFCIFSKKEEWSGLLPTLMTAYCDNPCENLWPRQPLTMTHLTMKSSNRGNLRPWQPSIVTTSNHNDLKTWWPVMGLDVDQRWGLMLTRDRA